MPNEITHAAEVLKRLSQPTSPSETRFREVQDLLKARDKVLGRYRVVFEPSLDVPCPHGRLVPWTGQAEPKFLGRNWITKAANLSPEQFGSLSAVPLRVKPQLTPVPEK